MTKHPKLTASSTSAPPGANEHDATKSAQNSPQGSRRQDRQAAEPNTDCCSSEVVGRHLDEIATRRQKPLERLPET
jgi:hypothetical protein